MCVFEVNSVKLFKDFFLIFKECKNYRNLF